MTTNEAIKKNKEKFGQMFWGKNAEEIGKLLTTTTNGISQYIAIQAVLDYLGKWGASGRGLTLAETIITQLGTNVEHFGKNTYTMSDKQRVIVAEFMADQINLASRIKEAREKGE